MNQHPTQSSPFVLWQISQVYSGKLHLMKLFFLPPSIGWCPQSAHGASSSGNTALAHVQSQKPVGWKGPQSVT